MKSFTYTSLGKNEIETISKLTWSQKKVISIQELKEHFIPKDYKDKNRLIYILGKKNILSPIKRGVYVFNPLEFLPTGRKINNYLIADALFPKQNYYIGYSSMFNWYDFTQQQFQIVYVINTTISAEKEIAKSTFQFIKVRPDFMYGLEKKEINGGTIMISDKERTMIDLLYWNEAVGGIGAAINTVKKIIKRNECDLDKLIAYTIKYPRKTIRKCMGVILDELEISNEATQQMYSTIVNTSITSVNCKSRRGKLNKKWRVIIDELA